MSRQSQASVTEPNRTSRLKVKPAVIEELTDDLAHTTKLPDGPGITVAGGAIEAQAARLGDRHFQTAQRHALGAQIGRVQGNQHLQRIVAFLKPHKIARVRTSVPAKSADSAPEHLYKQEALALTPAVGQVPVVQKTDWEAEYRASLGQAGVAPSFPPIHDTLRHEAHAKRFLTYQAWRRVQSNPSAARVLFGRAADQVWGVIRDDFLRYLLGRGGGLIGNVVTAFQALEQISEEGRWNDSDRDRRYEYREDRIYFWLLRQLSLRLCNTRSWTTRANRVYQALVRQDINYRYWLDMLAPGFERRRSRALREARVRELEAEGMPRERAEERARVEAEHGTVSALE